MEKVLAAMQQPFPALTRLRLWFIDESSLVIPASFLGGSAPSLQTLSLNVNIPFSGLPDLLLSATHLICLCLYNVPHLEYISPEVMVTCLSVLTRLELLSIEFEPPRSHPNPGTRRSPPRTRILLPVLTQLSFSGFSGFSEYLEGLMARIDAPLLHYLQITFFHQLTFCCPQLAEFIDRTPRFKGHDEARVEFSQEQVCVTLQDGALVLGITASESGWQLSSLAQVYSSSFPRAFIRTVKCLYIIKDDVLSQLLWQDDVESSQWLELFHPFTAVTDLYLSSEFTQHIAPALQELVGERVTEVLPALQTLFLEDPSGPDREAIGQFVAARQLASRPPAVSHWEREDEESSDETDEESYETDDE